MSVFNPYRPLKVDDDGSAPLTAADLREIAERHAHHRAAVMAFNAAYEGVRDVENQRPMTWIVTVPLWRAGKGVPIPERIDQLERFKGMTGDYAVPFDDERKANAAAFLWSQALGFSVEAKRHHPIPTDDGSYS